MRNIVNVIKPVTPKKPTVVDLETGEIFRYDTSTDQVYIKAQHKTLGTCVVSLVTGEIYTDFRHEGTVYRVSEISIKRP